MWPVAFFVQADRIRPAAQQLSGVAISAESPLFLLRRIRSLGRVKLTSAKKLSEWGKWAALPLCFRPAGLTEQTDITNVGETLKGRRCFLRSRHG